MIERSLWHPVASLAELDAGKPLAIRLLDQPLVVWRDDTHNVHVWADRCPHRGTPLSMGRVVGNHLECAYHGWQFEAGGRCAAIPALPGFMPGAPHAACAYESRVAYGMVFVRLDKGATDLPAITGAPARQIVCGPFDVATSAPRVVENFLDTAHFGFVHEGYLGDRGNVEVPHYEVETTAHGTPVVPHYRAWQPKGAAVAGTGAWVDYRYEVTGPYGALLVKHADAKAGAESFGMWIALWACPVTAESCRAWFTEFTADPHVPDADLIAFQTTIFTQDKPVVESQVPRRLPLAPDAEAHCAADRLSAAYRRYLKQRAITFGVC